MSNVFQKLVIRVALFSSFVNFLKSVLIEDSRFPYLLLHLIYYDMCVWVEVCENNWSQMNMSLEKGEKIP